MSLPHGREVILWTSEDKIEGDEAQQRSSSQLQPNACQSWRQVPQASLQQWRRAAQVSSQLAPKAKVLIDGL